MKTRLDYLKEQHLRLDEDLRAAQRIADIYTIPRLEKALERVSRERTWLSYIDAELPFPHAMSSFDQKFDRITVRWDIAGYQSTTLLGKRIAIPDGGIAYTYDMRYTDTFPPFQMVVGELTHAFINQYPELQRALNAVKIANLLIPYIQRGPGGFLWDRMEPLAIWHVQSIEPDRWEYAKSRAEQLLTLDADKYSEIDMIRDRAGDQWSEVSQLCAFVLFHHHAQIDWTPFLAA